MLLRIPAVLDAEALEAVRVLLARGRFVDGKLSAGEAAKRVKRNEEMDSRDPSWEELNRRVMLPLTRHPVFQAAVLPLKVATPFYARYTTGMGYGDHIDDPVMGPGPRYRSDVAITVFLNEPDAYAGGELTVRTPFGEQIVKLAAGDAVLYPASSLHRVAPVTAGERLVAVIWAQSMVRDPARRELLYELSLARERMLRERPEAEETRQVDHAYVNLVRMWAEV
jgi:PKHD-type hydroxylase